MSASLRKELVLIGKKIEDADLIVAEHPSLNRANFSSNFITSARPFGRLPDLKELILDNNQITFYSDIYALAGLRNITSLSLAGNPITILENYREAIIFLIP